MSQAPPGSEPHTLLVQCHADRYNPVRKDALINQLDHSFGKSSLATGLKDSYLFTWLTTGTTAPTLTFEELNANCPDANHPVFHSNKSLDKLPNTNGIATVTEASKMERELANTQKLTTISSPTTHSIQNLLDETSAVQYVCNPHLVEGMVKRAIPLEIKTQISVLTGGLDLRSNFYLSITKSNRVQLDQTYMSMINLHKFLKKVQGVASQASDKSEEQRGIEAGHTSQQIYLDEDLQAVFDSAIDNKLK